MPCMKNGIKSIGSILLSAALLFGCSGGGSSASGPGVPLPSGEVVSVEIPEGEEPTPPPPSTDAPPPGEATPTPIDPPSTNPPVAPTPPLIVDGWMLKHKETFDTPLPANLPWERDAYGQPEDPWDEDGSFFFKKYESFGKNFADELGKFLSFRKSFRYSENGWLTFELYGRDANASGTLDLNEHGGEFLISQLGDGNRVLQLNNTVHYDGAEVRSTEPLPSEYRIRLEVTPVSAGGRDDDSVWRKNGYSDKTETADPWRFSNQSTAPLEAWRENGFYFLAILDTKPMPHNNVWIHHHRKVVIDSDNNFYDDLPGNAWSTIWTPRGRITEGSHPVSMLALDGNNFGSVWTGNPFHCFYNGAFRGCGPTGHTAADAYINGETYTVTIERNATHYVLEVSGRFQYGGVTTYRGAIDFRKTPVWHYNNTPEDAPRDKNSQPLKSMGIDWNAWPGDSAYPDYFMFGDPHITHYEGTVLYDDVELWVRP